MGEASRDVIVAAKVPRSGVVRVNEAACLACRECEVACSLGHERECNPHLSRVQIDFDDFRPGLPTLRVCKQCDWPACYYACAASHREPALRIDEATGARYVDEGRCTGCGLCVRACPLTPERPVIHLKPVASGKYPKAAFKCDLCMDRPAGPLCVQVCPGGALTFASAAERRG